MRHKGLDGFLTYASSLLTYALSVPGSSHNEKLKTDGQITYNNTSRMDIIVPLDALIRAKESLHSPGVEESDRHYDL